MTESTLMKTGSEGTAKDDPRVYFAAERTFLAWIRTGLSMMGFGFVVARFGLFLREMQSQSGAVAQSPRFSLWFGTALVFLGVGVNLAAIFQHRHAIHQLRANNWQMDNPSRLGTAIALLLACAGIVVAFYLILMH